MLIIHTAQLKLEFLSRRRIGWVHKNSNAKRNEAMPPPKCAALWTWESMSLWTSELLRMWTSELLCHCTVSFAPLNLGDCAPLPLCPIAPVHLRAFAPVRLWSCVPRSVAEFVMPMILRVAGSVVVTLWIAEPMYDVFEPLPVSTGNRFHLDAFNTI